MDNIYLTHCEKRLLFLMRFKKKVKPSFDVSMLVSYGLITPNSSGVKNSIGEHLTDGTYSLSDKGNRYFIQIRENFFTTRLPVLISLIALVKSFWPEISAFCCWIIEKLN